MILNKDERVWLVEHVFREGDLYTDVVRRKFAEKYPSTAVPDADAVRVLVDGFRETGTVVDLMRYRIESISTISGDQPTEEHEDSPVKPEGKYKYIPRPLQKIFGLSKEMLLVFGITQGLLETSTQLVVSLLICDSDTPARDVNTPDQLVKTTFDVRRADQDLIVNLASDEVEFDLGETLFDRIWKKTIVGTQFVLKNRLGLSLEGNRITIVIKSAQGDSVLVEKDAVITLPETPISQAIEPKSSFQTTETQTLELEPEPQAPVSYESSTYSWLQNCPHHHKSLNLIGQQGGLISVGGCEVSIPSGALDNDVEIEIEAFYGATAYQAKEDKSFLTPLLLCKPHGLQFNCDIEITLPTCYRTNMPILVEIQTTSDENIEFATHETLTMTPQTTYFKFSTKQFSWYSAIPQSIQQFFGLSKEMSLILAVAPGTLKTPAQMVASLLICDNVSSAKDLKNLNQLIDTTFLVTYALSRREDGDISANFTSDEVDFDPKERLVAGIWRKTRIETHVMMRNFHGLSLGDNKIKVILKSVPLQSTLEDKELFIRKECLVTHHPAVNYDITTDTFVYQS